jgi:uncharacterized membrane protein
MTLALALPSRAPGPIVRSSGRSGRRFVRSTDVGGTRARGLSPREVTVRVVDHMGLGGNPSRQALRYHEPHLHLGAPFGSDWFGRKAERFARCFGTPAFLIGQTLVVIAWIAANAAGIAFRWDPYPFILLNLAFSTQAAYAAPLILLAQTRQADRDKALAIADAEQRDALAREGLQRQDEEVAELERLRSMLESNVRATAELERLIRRLHGRVFATPVRTAERA